MAPWAICLAALCLATLCEAQPTLTTGRGLGTAWASDGTYMLWAGGEQASVCQTSRTPVCFALYH